MSTYGPPDGDPSAGDVPAGGSGSAPSPHAAKGPRIWPFVLIGVVLLLCVGCGCGGGGYLVYRAVRGSSPSGQDRPIAKPGDAGVATLPGTDPVFAKIGDCLVDAPTVDNPREMKIAPCDATQPSTVQSYIVKKRYNHSTNTGICHTGWWYRWDSADNNLDFVLCIEQR